MEPSPDFTVANSYGRVARNRSAGSAVGPRIIPRHKLEIRTNSRKIETFDCLRYWAYAAIAEYRCGPRETWDEVVDARAHAIAVEVRVAHPAASHPFSDQEVSATAKSAAGWVWSRYDGASLTRAPRGRS